MAEEKKKTEVAVVTKREYAQVASHVPVFDTNKFEHICRVAQAIAAAPMLPEHLKAPTERETVGNCVLIVSKALAWNMDPFDVAMATAVVHGKLCYEGKLIAAMLEGNHGVRLHYKWNDKTGDAFGIEVSGTRPGDTEPVSIEGTVGDWKTFTKPKANSNAAPRVQKQWEGVNARRQLAYRGAREWARIYMPSAIIGIYAIDEVEPDDFGRGGSMRNVREAPAISASFADEEELPAKDVSTDIINEEPDPAPDDEPAAETGGETSDQKQEGFPPDTGDELDLSGGEVVEESPFDPRDEDEGDADQASEGDDPPFDPDEDDEPALSESGDEESEGDEDPAITQGELDALADAKTWVQARDACLKVLKGELFMRASFEAQEEARKAAYGVLAVRADAPRVDEDVVLFRLWITIVDDIDELEDAWSAIQQTDGFTKQKPSGQGQLKNAVELAYERFTPGGE